MDTHRRRALLIGASAVSLLFATQAFAQDIPPVAEGPVAEDKTQAGTTAADDIIVTALRRSERLDRVPIAASVISGADLQSRAVLNVNDLANQVPGLSIQNQNLLNYVNIRGVGLQATNPATSSGVAVYSDGVFIAHETSIGDPYYDVAQIEVLRGPQGTLVGQSSTGGAIFVNSVRPSFDRVTGYVRATGANYNSYRGEGAINLPLASNFAIRVAGHIDTKDSFSTNVSPLTAGLQPGGYDGYSARLGVKWTPSDTIDVYLKTEIGERHGDGYVGKPFGEVAGTSLSSIGHPELRDPFTISYNTPSFDKYHSWKTSLEVNWKLSDSVTLRSVSGYLRQHNALTLDDDYNSVAGRTLQQDIKEYTISQEINLISNGTGPFNWVVGAFFLRDSVPTVLTNFTGPTSIYINARPLEHSYAAFAQVSYAISDQWKIELGGRYNNNRKTLTGTSSATIFLPPPFPPLVVPNPLTGTAKAEEPTGKIALNYFPNDDTTIYVSASRGFKSGGTNPVAPLLFEPETINAYEAGVKLRPTSHIRLSGAIFYYDYKNMQLSLLTLDPVFAAQGQSAITNAPKATIYGAEFEANAKFGGLALNGSVSYTHSRIDELTAADARDPAAGPQNLAGRQLAYAPSWTANAGATYTVPTSFGSVSGRVQYSYTAKQFGTPFQLVSAAYSPLNGFAGANDTLGAHSLIDAHVTLRFDNGLSVEAFGTNLTDERYVAGTSSGFAAVYAPPRQYGLRLGYDF